MCFTVQLSRSCCRMTAPIFYHTIWSLSRTFLKSFFQDFCLFATAMIDYHIFKALSRTFFKSFQPAISLPPLSFSNFDMLPYPEVFVNNFFWSYLTFLTVLTVSGERGIWTLARREPSTPLAGAPLQPLEYFSNAWIILLFNSAPHEQYLL